MWKTLKSLPKGWRQTFCPLTFNTKSEKTLPCSNEHREDICEQQSGTEGNSEADAVKPPYLHFTKKHASVTVPDPNSVPRIEFHAKEQRQHLTRWQRVSSHENFGNGTPLSYNIFDFLGFGFIIAAGLKFCRNGYVCNDERKNKKSVTSEGLFQWDALLKPWPPLESSLQRTVLPIGSAVPRSVSSESVEEEGDESNPSCSSSPLLQEHLIRLQDITAQYAAIMLNEDALQLIRENRLAEAVEEFNDASELGLDKAAFNLGVCYEIGQGVKQDLNEARSCYERAAKLGHANASYNLAVFYLEGKGMERNEREGLTWMERASDNGMKEAQTYLGSRYARNKEYEKAVNLFIKAVGQRHSEAEYFLGLCYENGLGVDENLTEAARLFSRSAKAGDVNACYHLAAYYERGLGGLAEDKNYAMDLYFKAATVGHPLALKKLEVGLEDERGEAPSVTPTLRTEVSSSKQDGIRAVSSLPNIESIARNVEKTMTNSSSLFDLTTVKKFLVNYFEFNTSNKRKKYFIDEEEFSDLLNDFAFQDSKTLIG